MKMNKKKIIYFGVLAIAVLFIAVYSYLVFGPENPEFPNDGTKVPSITEVEEIFQSKKQAIDAIKKEKPRTPPDIYQAFTDSLEQEESSPVISTELPFNDIDSSLWKIPKIKTEKGTVLREEYILRHTDFFQQVFETGSKDASPLQPREILVEVYGDHTLRTGERIIMRSLRKFELSGITYEKHTYLYGIVSIGSNRVFIDIKNLLGSKYRFKAYDEKDGLLGVYMKTSLEGEVRDQVVGDVMEEIRVPGFPQVSGLKKIFKRNRRPVKVTIYHKYKLLLKERP